MISALPPLATPRYMTPRTPGSATLGPRVAKIATRLGRPPKRWQRMWYDLALELDEKGRRRYHTCILSIQRQAGKTTADNMMGIHRALIQPEARVWFTAQTGQAARERWIEETATPAETALSSLVKVKYGAGDTRLTIPANGSQFRPMPPTADYLHGSQSDLVMIDEGWVHSEAAGAALLQAIVPTQTTRQFLSIGPQVVFSSTMGDASSTWWHNKLADAIENQPPGVAILDFGISPDTDPTDLEAVARAHPAFGEGVTMETLAEAAETLSPSEFARGYGNVATLATRSLIDAAVLDEHETDSPLDAGPVHIGVAVAWSHDLTAITAAGRIDGAPAIEVITARPGTAWVPDVLAHLARTQEPAAIILDPHGPTGSIEDKIRDVLPAGAPLVLANADDLIRGTEALLAGMDSPAPSVWIRRDPDLRNEIAGAALRSIGDRGRVVSRKSSLGSIARLEAGILALRSLTTVAPSIPAPMIWSPDA